MRALTLWQPRASLVALGAKKIETRSWPTQYRGPLAIHAAKAFGPAYRVLAYHQEPFRTVLVEAGLIPTQQYGMVPEGLPLGAIVAVCELVACERMTDPLIAMVGEPERSFGDYQRGRWMWILKGIRRLREPIPAKGARGLWEWEPPADLEARLA